MSIFSTEDQERIIHAINLAENKTSGEIRVAVEKRCKSDALSRATYFFEKLGMHKTALQNGVLIYMAVEDHTFAIIGDEGIDRLVGTAFWNETKSLMTDYFRKGELVTGIVEGIKHTGRQLKTYFPESEDDINELPNDIVFGDQ